MTRKPNTVGGGATTNFNGLRFEGRMDLLEAINQHPDYSIVNGNEVIKNDKVVALYFEKHKLYKNYLQPHGINYKDILSKKLLPDGALLVDKTMFIIEKKYQAGSGSVDEKLQTCDFKKKQYIKLFKPLNITVEYYYVLSDWFDNPKNKDVFEYIESVGCKYFIEKLPLKELNL
ncbi:MAG: hypothetical protein KAG95_00080 [Bacteroidales bacterium]|nr:hypothetical protein [Bacteroidales bacterium]